ncbi:hypothetical protein Emed_007255 [Eimeria media]
MLLLLQLLRMCRPPTRVCLGAAAAPAAAAEAAAKAAATGTTAASAFAAYRCKRSTGAYSTAAAWQE